MSKPESKQTRSPRRQWIVVTLMIAAIAGGSIVGATLVIGLSRPLRTENNDQSDLPKSDQSAVIGRGLLGRNNSVSHVRIDPQGRWLVTNSPGTTPRLWDLKATDPAASSQILECPQSELSMLAFAPDGTRLIAAFGRERTVTRTRYELVQRTGEVDGRTETYTVQVPVQLTETQTSPREIRVWNLKDGEFSSRQIEFPADTDSAVYLQVSSDGRWLAVLSEDLTANWNQPREPRWTARMWALGDMAVEHKPRLIADANDALFSPDGNWLALSAPDGIALHRLKDNAEYGEPLNLALGDLRASELAFSPDAKWLLAVPRESVVPPPPPCDAPDSEAAPGVREETSSDPSRDMSRTDALLWRIGDSRPPQAIQLSGHPWGIGDYAFSSDSRWLITHSYRSDLLCWDLTAENSVANPLTLPAAEFFDLSPDGKRLLAYDGKKTLRMWDLQAKNVSASERVLSRNFPASGYAQFSPDGKWLVEMSFGTYAAQRHIWLRDLRSFSAASESYLVATVSNADNATVLLEGYGPFLNRSNADFDQQFDSPSYFQFSPSGKFFVAAGPNQSALLFDLTVESPRRSPIVLRGHSADVVRIYFSADERWLVTDASTIIPSAIVPSTPTMQPNGEVTSREARIVEIPDEDVALAGRNRLIAWDLEAIVDQATTWEPPRADLPYRIAPAPTPPSLIIPASQLDLRPFDEGWPAPAPSNESEAPAAPAPEPPAPVVDSSF